MRLDQHFAQRETYICTPTSSRFERMVKVYVRTPTWFRGFSLERLGRTGNYSKMRRGKTTSGG
jgi:hypothetical protein